MNAFNERLSTLIAAIAVIVLAAYLALSGMPPSSAQVLSTVAIILALGAIVYGEYREAPLD